MINRRPTRWNSLFRLFFCLWGTCVVSHLSAAEEPVPLTGREDPRLASFDTLLVDFVREHQVPGCTLAVTRNGRLVYSRGAGFADREKQEPVAPDALFRIASISKPITAVAILQLVDQGKLSLDDLIWEKLQIRPHLARNAKVDPRWKQVTIRHCLQHTGGWDRDASFDPMFRSVEIAKALGKSPPAKPPEIIRYMGGMPLDFDPGAKYAYSNFGYSLLGRVVEKITGQPYEKAVQEMVLRPIGATATQLGRTDAALRKKGEVKYYDTEETAGPAVIAKQFGKKVPGPYGTFALEPLDAHGGWLSTAPDLVRFAADFDDPAKSKLLSPARIEEMFTRPPGLAGHDDKGEPNDTFYGLGWMVRPRQKDGPGSPGHANHWHTGSIPGTSTLLVRRLDGLTWAILFNTRDDAAGKRLSTEIDPLIHKAADAVREWPEGDVVE